MPIPDYVLRQIECCLNENENHILVDPVLLKCGGNACKECVTGSIKCQNCNGRHLKGDFTENKSTESIIRFFMNDLRDNLDKDIRCIKDLLNGFYFIFYFKLNFEIKNFKIDEDHLNGVMQNQIECLEYEINLRVESLITQIYKYRDEYLTKLRGFKTGYER